MSLDGDRRRQSMPRSARPKVRSATRLRVHAVFGGCDRARLLHRRGGPAHGKGHFPPRWNAATSRGLSKSRGSIAKDTTRADGLGPASRAASGPRPLTSRPRFIDTDDDYQGDVAPWR